MRSPEEPNHRMVELHSRLITDVTLLCGSSVEDASRDASTLRRRVRCEGLGFLVKNLPRLGKAIDKSFKTGTLEVPASYRTGRDSKIPVFLRGIFRCAYNEDGSLRSTRGPEGPETIEAIRGLRQICFLWYKLQTGFSPNIVASTLAGFVATDEALLTSLDVDRVLLVASQLLEEVLCDFNPYDIRPGHGPGAVATGEKPSEKWTFKRRYTSLNSEYPFAQYFCVGGLPEYSDRREWYDGIETVDVPTAKVVLVPKDSRGPRIISMEPLEIQWIQQGIRNELYPYIENHPLTRGYVNFTDQGVNQALAEFGSRTGTLATLDLKDASDRVSLALVEAIYPDDFCRVLNATRSTSTILPDGTKVTLKKFAPMGSALCFPIEALTFWALALGVINVISPGNERLQTKGVWVYGDDLVVPTEYAEPIMSVFRTYGLEFSEDKCFTTGPFRESCGVDSLSGVDITPVRARFFPDSGQKTPLCSVVPHMDALAASLWQRGYWRAGEYTHTCLRELVPLPYGVKTSPYVCVRLEKSEDALRLNLRSPRRLRWNCGTQQIEIHGYKIENLVYQDPEFDGWVRLLRSLTVDAGERPTFFPSKVTWMREAWMTL